MTKTVTQLEYAKLEMQKTSLQLVDRTVLVVISFHPSNIPGFKPPTQVRIVSNTHGVQSSIQGAQPRNSTNTIIDTLRRAFFNRMMYNDIICIYSRFTFYLILPDNVLLVINSKKLTIMISIIVDNFRVFQLNKMYVCHMNNLF